MAGIFGCASLTQDCKDLYKMLEEHVDRTRGKIVNEYISSNFSIALQSHYSPKIELIKWKGNSFVSLISDLPAATYFPMLETLKSAYSKGGVDALATALNHAVYGDTFLIIGDEKKKRLILTSDLCRKVFYAVVNKTVFFSSSIKHLVIFLKKINVIRGVGKEDIDLNALIAYLTFGCTPPGKTIFSRIKKPLPKELLIFHLRNGDIDGKVYFQVNVNPTNISEKGFLDSTYNTLLESVKRRIERKVVAGVSLSGGLDSSILCALLTKLVDPKDIIALSLSMEGFYDETDNARETADFLGLRLTSVKVPSKSTVLINEFKNSVSKLEEPSPRSGYLSRHICLSNLKDSSKTVFMGEGGDEVFLGYFWWYWNWDEDFFIKNFVNLPKKFRKVIFEPLKLFERRPIHAHRLIRILSRLNEVAEVLDNRQLATLVLLSMNPFPKHLGSILKQQINLGTLFSHQHARLLDIPGRSGHLDRISKQSYLLTMMLTQTDIMVDESFASRLGLKLMLPFLDTDVVRYMISTPSSFKLRNGVTKYHIRKLASIYKLLPKKIITCNKFGFITPATLLCRDEEFRIYIKDVAMIVKESVESKVIKTLSDATASNVSHDDSAHVQLLRCTAPLIQWLSYLFEEN